MWNAESIAKKFINLNEQEIYSKVVNTPEIKAEAVRLNTQVQLYEKGENTFGQKMRSIYARFGNWYSSFTINLKQEKRQPTDRVTLKDTGEFYSTFKARYDGELKITANTIKDGEDLQITWGQVIGLNEESKTELVQKIKPKAISYVKDKILG
jgi:hypothetical protein